MSEDLAFALERSFLAQEFLTWIWFRCEVDGGEFDLPEGSMAVVVEDALSLVSWDEDDTRVGLRGGNPTLRPEAANSLAAGLMLRKARLFAARGDREWQFSLDGETLDLSGVKVPETPEGEEVEDPLADKLAACEELRGMIDALFRLFLGVRLCPDWERIEVPRLQAWVGQKLERARAEVSG